jgi:hypothetical protein
MLAPGSNRRPRCIIFGLVFLIVGANIVSAIALASHVGTSRQPMAPAMRTTRPLARSTRPPESAPRNISHN